MIKKIMTSVLACLFMVLSVVTLTGCSKGAKNYSQEGIISNGGIAVVKNGFMYYIAGGTDKLDEPDQKMIASASIYRRAVDEKGNPIDGMAPEVVYSGIAGFEYGSLYAFGDYLYFTTPSSKVTSKAEKTTDRTSFCRIRMDGKKYKVLYTTETAEDLKYAYYTSNEDELYIAILEGTELYSYNVRKDKINEIASDVTSAVFSNSFGTGSEADKFIYYTSTPSEKYLTQNGNMVYKADITGETKVQLSSGENITLYEVKYGYLYFSDGSKIYRTTTENGLDKSNVVSYAVYKNPFFTANGGVVATGETSGQTQLVYFVWEGGAKVTSKILATNKGYTPYFTDGNILYALDNNKKLVKLTLDDGATETAKDTVIIDKVTISVGGGLNPEIVGDYLYFYVETKTTDKNGNSISTWDIQSVKL